MKKTIAVLMVIAMVAGLAFAADVNHNDKLTLQAKALPIAPIINLFYTGEDGKAEATRGPNDSQVITGIDPITDGNVVAYFILKQNNPATDGSMSRYGNKAGKDVTLTVTCAPFIYYGQDADNLVKDSDFTSGYPVVAATKGTSTKG